MDYHNKKFRPIRSSGNSALDTDTIFKYQQSGKVLTCAYSGGGIEIGHLIGIVDEQGKIDMRYHQISKDGEIMTGICLSTPEILINGKIRLNERWQWTSGDLSKGSSILEEI